MRLRRRNMKGNANMDDKKLNETFKKMWDSLSDEQKEKAKECKTAEELFKLAAEEKFELSDEFMNAVAGGVIYQGEPGYTTKTAVCEKCGGEIKYQVMWLPGWSYYEPVAPRFCPECRLR